MSPADLQSLLSSVASGTTTIADALQKLRRLPFEQLPFATIDHHRSLRCGHPEVIFCQGKTTEQIVAIALKLSAGGQTVLATRAAPDHLAGIRRDFPGAIINDSARAALISKDPHETADDPSGVVLISAGTADFPVAEEAAMTLRSMCVPTHRLVDVGVSGLHRLLPHVERLQQACAIVVVAGMEGALPSVVGGLVACPVFAVPTSVGYGASFGGLAALLGMLNSCASNVTVVNIDNGFGAAFSASLVYKQVQNAIQRSPPRHGDTEKKDN